MQCSLEGFQDPNRDRDGGGGARTLALLLSRSAVISNLFPTNNADWGTMQRGRKLG